MVLFILPVGFPFHVCTTVKHYYIETTQKPSKHLETMLPRVSLPRVSRNPLTKKKKGIMNEQYVQVSVLLEKKGYDPSSPRPNAFCNALKIDQELETLQSVYGIHQ